MRYIRQDTTRDDELKIENRLEALKWQWDFKNIMALIIITILALMLIYAQIYTWYCNNLPDIAYKNPVYDDLVRFTFQVTFAQPCTGIFKALTNTNYLLAYNLSEFCIRYDILL
jgi:hypothetical protein